MSAQDVVARFSAHTLEHPACSHRCKTTAFLSLGHSCLWESLELPLHATVRPCHIWLGCWLLVLADALVSLFTVKEEITLCTTDRQLQARPERVNAWGMRNPGCQCCLLYCASTEVAVSNDWHILA